MPKEKLLQEARVLSRQELAEGVCRLWLQAPETAAAAKPGQFVQVRIPGGGVLLRRPLGLAELRPEEGALSLIYRRVGRGTEILSRLASGERVGLLGPLGHGFKSSPGKALLVGGGMGLSPLLCYARHLARLGCKAEVLMGGRTAEELFWRDLFEPYASALYLATDDGSLGRHGFVTAVLPELLEKGSYAQVTVCGPEIMMRSAAELAVAKGIPCEVSLERRMACGLGACLSCSVDTAHGRRKVCKDGPVFSAEEVFF